MFVDKVFLWMGVYWFIVGFVGGLGVLVGVFCIVLCRGMWLVVGVCPRFVWVGGSVVRLVGWLLGRLVRCSCGRWPRSRCC